MKSFRQLKFAFMRKSLEKLLLAQARYKICYIRDVDTHAHAQEPTNMDMLACVRARALTQTLTHTVLYIMHSIKIAGITPTARGIKTNKELCVLITHCYHVK